MSDAKVAFYRSIGLTGSLPDMERDFFEGSFVRVPYIVAQTAVPVIVVPNGTVATNGTITLGTALPIIYSGGAWIRLPAGAVVGGQAGLYWCVFSSTTVGQVYTAFNAASSEFIPNIPSPVVAAVGSNVAYTQATASDIVLVNITLEAGALGLNGSFRLLPYVASPNNANNKIWKTKAAASTLNSTTNTTAVADARPVVMRNFGSYSLNFASGFIGYSQGGSTYPYTRLTVDTSVDVSVTITGQLAVATDYLCLDAFSFEVLPSL